MLTKLLKLISPLSKYLTIIGLVGAFLTGGMLTRTYYLNQINKIEATNSRQVVKYMERVMELDGYYITRIDNINKRLIIIKKELDNELQKPEYLCPVPTDGIRLLNDAIKANQSKNSN